MRIDNEFVLADSRRRLSTSGREDSEDYLPLETQEEFSTEAQEDIYEDG